MEPAVKCILEQWTFLLRDFPSSAFLDSCHISCNPYEVVYWLHSVNTIDCDLFTRTTINPGISPQAIDAQDATSEQAVQIDTMRFYRTTGCSRI